MIFFFGKILRWFGRHFTSFVVIVAILTAGRFIWVEVQQYRSHTWDVESLEKVKTDTKQYQHSLGDEVIARVASFNKATTDKLTQRIAEIDMEIAAKAAAQRAPGARKLSILKGDIAQVVADFRGEVKLSFLPQERNFLRYLLDTAIAIKARDAGKIKLEQLRQAHKVTYDAYQKDVAELNGWEKTNPVKCELNPWSDIGKRCKQLKSNIPTLFKSNQEAYDNYLRQQKFLDTIVIVERKFVLQRDEALKKLETEISAGKKILGENWVSKIFQPVREELWPAFWILLSIIFTPIAIKAGRFQ